MSFFYDINLWVFEDYKMIDYEAPFMNKFIEMMFYHFMKMSNQINDTPFHSTTWIG